MANRIVGGTGEVDSAKPAQRMWLLARLVAADTSLTAEFDAGLRVSQSGTCATPFQAAVDEFLADHGHRGNDEYELATRRGSWTRARSTPRSIGCGTRHPNAIRSRRPGAFGTMPTRPSMRHSASCPGAGAG